MADAEINRLKARTGELKEAATGPRRAEEERHATEDMLRQERKKLEQTSTDMWKAQKAATHAVEDYKKSEEFSDLIHDMSAPAYILGIRKGTEHRKRSPMSTSHWCPTLQTSPMPRRRRMEEPGKETSQGQESRREPLRRGGGEGSDMLPSAKEPPSDPSASHCGTYGPNWATRRSG